MLGTVKSGPDHDVMMVTPASFLVAMVISLTDQMLFQEVQPSPQELVSHPQLFWPGFHLLPSLP